MRPGAPRQAVHMICTLISAAVPRVAIESFRTAETHAECVRNRSPSASDRPGAVGGTGGLDFW